MSKMVKKIFWALAGICGILAAAVAVTVGLFPAQALAALARYHALRAGLSLHAISVKGYRIPYYHGGSGPPLVLLHGWSDSKDAFLQSARWLGERYTIYLPDLPGHGDTAHEPGRRYGAAAQVETLRDFTAALGLGTFHLGGNSMGGHIAAAFAIAHPQAVVKLVLLDPAGLRVDDPVPYSDQPAPMDTIAKYDAFMRRVFVHPPPAPDSIKRLFIQRAVADFAWLNRMLADLRSDGAYLLNDRLGEIQAPTLIVWGEGDGIISIKHAPVWHAGVTGSILVTLTGCGHAPQYERPQATARLLLEFLGGRCSPQGCAE